MNRHFTDTRYYLRRAAETAMAGVAAELAPVERRVRTALGREKPATGRLATLKANLTDVRATTTGEAKGAVTDARQRIEAYREPGA